ncbi:MULTISPECIES: ribokinase [Streptomycetaceae]|uniref:Ribokinase n=1 Tax=Streptantibioticus cattleyicolor (strain ATCC 35852 / DSM 46488 / JCM 4925 / NBRC 14057 / NRRL 8057) TaxID=1003195 RepID=F8JS92_STREN|nr:MULTISPECIES: ribokinase [Streptomycetaceae]AEW94204.1 ribokinase [Streptantibioticus cattleyicolor NRRL 8057 = DSM 46488]MYS58864.1 ribokinase [Streptomyces sp. SID5468]CCB74559.1 Ribokinase [Streptantibioticus cattleyicolor NRRL 8057 = DSM 46488]
MRDGEDGYDLVVVGSANADLVVRVERRPAPGETVIGTGPATHPGGKGANQAVAAARLGARTALLARVGDDDHGRLLLDTQRSAGVDTGGVLVGGAPTGVALVAVDPSGDRGVVLVPGANARLTPHDVAAAGALLAAARVVAVQLEIPLETVAAAVREAVRARTRVVLNASPPARLPAEVLAACDPLLVDGDEARALLRDAGDPAADSAAPKTWAEALAARGPRSVVITLGASGALAAGPDGIVHVPGRTVEAVDTTGAGDAFAGALAWRLAAGDGLAEAVRLAVRAGAAAVTRPGAQAAFPTARELP